MNSTIDIEGGDYLIKVRSDDSQAFHEVIQGLKDCVDPAYRRWQPSAKSWRILPEGQLLVMDWLNVCRSRFSAQVSWSKQRGEVWRPPAQKVDPFSVLHLLPTAPPEVVKAAYKALAQLHHPDRGGDLRQMQNINAAYSEVTRRLAA